MNGYTGVIAAAALVVAAFAAGMFSGIWVDPDSFEAYKYEHARLEHEQSERLDAIGIKHTEDVGNIKDALGGVREELAGVTAGQQAILRELSQMRREMQRRPR